MLSRIILIEFPWGRDKDPRVPLGHASLLAVLNMDSGIKYHSIIQEINDPNFTTKSVIEEIQSLFNEFPNESFDIAMGVYVWAEEAIQELIRRLRHNGFSGRIILGGPQISYAGKDLENYYPEADIFVRGYGEMAIYELATSINKSVMNGIHYTGDVDLLEQTVVDLELFPSPWLTGVINVENQKFIRWESQRGCPFSCGFCQHKEAGARLKKREFSTSRIMKEIDLFCEHKVVDVAVLDPIFNASKQSTKILQRFLQNGFKGRLSLQCRAEMADDEFINIASKLNIRMEFGLQTIHDEEGSAVNRKNNIKFVEETFSKINSAEIEYEVSIIYGLPEQTLDSFLETIQWCIDNSVPTIKAFPLMLLRGTDIEQRKAEWSFIESEGSMPCVIQSNTFSFEEWCQMNRISEALKQTEGNQPKSIEELLRIAEKIEIDHSRFRPELSLKKGREVIFRGGYSEFRLEIPQERYLSYCLS